MIENEKISQIISVARELNYPTRHLNVFGITGTNGKTSCSHFLAQCLTRLKVPCGIIGTVGIGFPHELRASALTTPDGVTLQQRASELLNRGAQALAMEVSSHALVQGRVNQVHFSTAIFTNLSHDHLDYHGTMDAYGAAKAQLFHWPSLKQAIVNIDDPFGYELYLELKQQPQLYVVGYSTQEPILSFSGHLVRAKQLTSNRQGLRAEVITPWGEGILQTRIIGNFHLHNILAVLASLGNLFPLENILEAIAELHPVAGRMQCFGGGEKPLVVVDYAHTPDALLNVMQALRAYHPRQLLCVFGCGGDRDVTKRALMGEIAEQWSDKVMITNDNPRTESPEKIVQDILEGIKNPSLLTIEYDRAKAIAVAISQARRDDIVLIAGKGHEDYQCLGDQRVHFSDQEEVEKILNSGALR